MRSPPAPLSALAMAPFDFWPVLFLTFPVLVWLIDGAARRTLGRRAGAPPPPAGGSASAIFSPASTGSGTPFWWTPRRSAGCCRSRSSRLPAGLAIFTALGVRARARAVDARRDAHPGARGRAHARRVAARPSADRISLEHLRLRADDAAGAGAERVAVRPLGPDLHRGRGLRQPGDARRRSGRYAGAAGCRRRCASLVLAALAGYGAVRLASHADRPSSTACTCASCSRTCRRTRNSITRQAAGDEPLHRAVRPRHRAAVDRRARRDASDLAGVGISVFPHARARRAGADRRSAAGRARC